MSIVRKLATKCKNIIKKCHRKFAAINSADKKVVSLKPKGTPRGNVLLSYHIELFLKRPGQPILHWQYSNRISFILAHTFLNLGYSVDVISNHNRKFMPMKRYAFFIDSRMNMERLSPLLNRECVKILFLPGGHAYFHNAATATRLLALQERKHVTLRDRRSMLPEWGMAIEYADCTIALSEFLVRNFRYANKPSYRIPNPTPFVYPWPEAKDFEACRTRFLWLGSSGMVHKGLDLVLEAFVQMPKYHLTVCGPVTKEKDFEQAYYQELYQTPNIETYGWIDIGSPAFMEVANSRLGIVYPSCSEGSAGAVLTCLQAGLIPIVSYESGVEVSDDSGVILRNCSIEEIKKTVQRICSLSPQELKQMARNAWEFARANHTMEKFEEECRKMVEKLIADYKR
jgi:glycosyltransferase involved in cell wall biosynthesis